MRLPQLLRTGFGWLIRLILVAIALGIVVVFTSIAVSWLIPVLCIVLTFAIWRSRRMFAVRVMSYLNQAIRTTCPLPAVLAAAARDEKRQAAVRLLRVRDDLEAGLTLAGTLERHVPQMDAVELSRIAVAERAGRLPETLTQLTHAFNEGVRRDPEPGAKAAYFLLLFTSLVLICQYLIIFVVPRLNNMFADPGIETSNVLVTGEFIAREGVGPAVIALLGLLIVLGLLPLVLLSGAMTLSGRWTELWRWAIDPVVWSTPVVRQVARDRALQAVCFHVDQSLRAGLPLHVALRESAKIRFNVFMRWRVKRWADAVDAGAPTDAAAREARMPRIVVGLVGPATHGDAARRSFEFLAAHFSERYSRVVELVLATSIPLVVAGLGLLVGAVAYGVFDAMRELTWAMAGMAPP